MNALFLLKEKNTVSYLLSDNTLRQGLEKLRAHGFTALPVIAVDGEYIGCISEGDFLWSVLEQNDTNIKSLEHILIQDIIRRDWNPPVRIDIQMSELLDRVINQNFVPVVDDRNKFIGIITRRDIICYFMEKNT